MNPENFSESLAEFTLYMKKEKSEIYCHCTRMTIDDRNLLFFAQENQNGDVSWCQHWNAENPTESGSEKSFSMISDSKEMEISHFGAEFETDDLTSAKEKRFHTDDVYVKPLVEFDDKFKEEEDEMKKMGLPLSFLGNPGAGDEKRIPAFKIKDTLGVSTSSTSVNKSKKQRKKKAKNISNQASDIPCMRWQKQLTEDETNMVDKEFETYWTSNGENLVRKSWDELYGEYVVKAGDEIDYDAHKSHDNLCDQFNQLDITEGPLSPSDFDNPFLALFPSGVSMREILISTGKISPEQEELLPEINWTHLWNEHWAKVCCEEYDKFMYMRTEQILDEKLIQDICNELIENVLRLQDEKLVEKRHQDDCNLAVDSIKKHSNKHFGNGMAYWVQKIAEDANSDSNPQGNSHSVENENQQKQTSNNTNENNATENQETNNHVAQNNLSNTNGPVIPCEDDDDDEPPDEFPIVKCQKRPHENEDHDESTKQRLKNSKAAKAFADLGFTFSPGEQLRYPDVSEIRAASVYFTSKDAVKRTKRLNINKKYTYNEDGDIVLGAMGSIKKFPKRHGGIQKAFENPVDEKSNADYDEDSQQQQSEETNKELSNDSEECNQMAVDVYVKSPVEFDDKFKEEEDEMKKMGLPLSFHGNQRVETEPEVKKYWHQRYRLFSKYDNGIVIGMSQKIILKTK